jgi:hypothetical protein
LAACACLAAPYMVHLNQKLPHKRKHEWNTAQHAKQNRSKTKAQHLQKVS